MKTTISKTVLTLTAFMSVNAVFANSLPPCIEDQKQVSAFTAEKTNNEKKLANSLLPTPEYKGLANTLPPTFDGRISRYQTVDIKGMHTQRVNMG